MAYNYIHKICNREVYKFGSPMSSKVRYQCIQCGFIDDLEVKRVKQK